MIYLILSLVAFGQVAPTPSIEWDAASLRLVAAGGDYGRIVRLADGRVAAVYDARGVLWFAPSDDHGRTFGTPVQVAADPECWLTNAELLPLASGDLLYFWSARPRAALARRRDANATPPERLTIPFRIKMSRSVDGGKTWTEAQTLYEAGTSFGDGCWEPAAVPLASGEVQVYFANEGPFRSSNEQEITRLRSTDGGKSWGEPERATFRPGHRDGMPAPLVLDDGRIVVAIEDDGLAGGRFKPVVVEVGEAGADPIERDRRGALAEPLDPSCYGGAPCLRRLPSGHVVLSYQESPDGTLAHSRMGGGRGLEECS